MRTRSPSAVTCSLPADGDRVRIDARLRVVRELAGVAGWRYRVLLEEVESEARLVGDRRPTADCDQHAIARARDVDHRDDPPAGQAVRIHFWGGRLRTA